MKIHLIRHGKTVANEQRLYCGATDLPLSEVGVTELCRLKTQAIYPKSVCFFYTSGLLRTKQTLELLYGSVQRSALPALVEFNFGSFEMQSYEMLKEQKDYQAWITDETGLVACPNGDNKQTFTCRVIDGYTQLMSKAQIGSIGEQGTVCPDDHSDSLVVCHGGVIACIMDYLFPATHNFYEWQPKPGRGYTIAYSGGNLKSYKKI